MADAKPSAPKPIFFPTPADFKAWLEKHYEGNRELWVGFYKKASGRPSITWPEAVDEALCVGWIDGLRKTIDGLSYKIRFTPRKTTSNWSAINIGRVQELTQQGRMRPAGLKSFAQRVPERSGIYAYENRHAAALSKSAEKQFRSSAPAWKFFLEQPASYQKTAIWWVVSAKRAETQDNRLKKLIAQSRLKRRI